jgi:5-methylcytosine-specific restriction endonuclease McrA
VSSKRLKKKVQYYSPKRRAVYSKGDQIDHLLLFELYGWKCWLCEKPINKNIRKPNHQAATIEHVTPLCQGGTHTWDNVVPAHALCNYRKGGALDQSHDVDNRLIM